VFQEAAQSPQFGQHREVGSGRDALAEQASPRECGDGETADFKLVFHAGIFRLGKPKAYFAFLFFFFGYFIGLPCHVISPPIRLYGRFLMKTINWFGLRDVMEIGSGLFE
jgi:hypothetical protein